MTFETLRQENDQLRQTNDALRQENVGLRQQLDKLTAQVQALHAQLQAAQRRGKRQAAPFSKGEPKPEPKTPGRKAGHQAEFRARPTQIAHMVDAPLPAHCPGCGGRVVEERVDAQYQVDIPPVQPVTTQFNVHIGHCQDCGQRVQGRHAEQTSDALGHAAVQIGPRALSLAAQAKHELGVPYAKVARLLSQAFGLTVNRSTLARADQRVAGVYLPVYLVLQNILRASAVVWGDETGWKVAGRPAWLWVFTTDSVTLYGIDPTRAHEVIERILGADFPGWLECDCFLAYDAVTIAQQKCLQHLIRRCDNLQTIKTGQAASFSREIMQLLRGAIHLQHRFRDKQITEHGYQVACGRLEAALDRQLTRRLRDPDNCRLAKLLLKQRDQLFAFLYHDELTPTNAKAEQAIRPAVAIRKMSACNRSPAGAETHAILTSIIRTCQQQGQDFLNWTIERLRSPAVALPAWLKALAPAPT